MWSRDETRVGTKWYRSFEQIGYWSDVDPFDNGDTYVRMEITHQVTHTQGRGESNCEFTATIGEWFVEAGDWVAFGYREGDLARGRVNRIVTGMSAECVIRPMTLFVFV